MYWKRAAKSSTYRLFERWQARSLRNSTSTTSIKKVNGQKVTVGISTGDFDTADNWLERYDVIITTNEKADSLLRHRAKWMDSISLGNRRRNPPSKRRWTWTNIGNCVGKAIQVNPHIQILALSATINNVDEIAGWLNAKYIVTEWRPINLKEGVMLQDEINTKMAIQEKLSRKPSFPLINLVLNTLKNGGQALIFTSTRQQRSFSGKNRCKPNGQSALS